MIDQCDVISWQGDVLGGQGNGVDVIYLDLSKAFKTALSTVLEKLSAHELVYTLDC